MYEYIIIPLDGDADSTLGTNILTDELIELWEQGYVDILNHKDQTLAVNLENGILQFEPIPEYKC